ncbi:MAG: hypothetical protein GY777_22610, partial [Candidatus Brocadiaceae bacterium]|nr:hypothetical protein [Candidatus Brocadiaceae bacterium]
KDLLATTKEYDGTTTATLTGGTLIGVVSTEDVSVVSLPTSGSFDTKDKGSIKLVTFDSIALTGSDKDNYTITQPTVTGEISAKVLTFKDLLATTKEYDGTTTATLTGGTLIGVVPTEDVSLVSLPTSGSFDTKYTGSTKTVTFHSVALTGSDKDNYAITQPAVTGEISAKVLTIKDLLATTKE